MLKEEAGWFFYYLNERELVRQAKEAGKPAPWTKDKILNKFSFTNVLREHDKTSRWAIENWYRLHHNHPKEVQLYNCGLFRYFGTMEFANAVGWQQEYNPDHIIKTAKQRFAEKKTVFTGAYVITNQGIKAPKEEVVTNIFLKNLWEAAPRLVEIFDKSQRWELVLSHLKNYNGFGGTGFMAKEVLQDAMFTSAMPREQVVDRFTYSPAGPGARRGLNRLYGRDLEAKISEKQAVEEMKILLEIAPSEFHPHMDEIKENFDLHAVQFGLCEYDKYRRVYLGQGRPRKTYRPGR